MMNALLLAISLLISITGQFLLKTGVLATPPTPTFTGIVTTFLSWRIVLGLSLYGFSTIIWLFILKRLPLSIAYPTLSLSYAIILLISVVFLGEAFTLNKAIGITAITVGVAFLYL